MCFVGAGFNGARKVTQFDSQHGYTYPVLMKNLTLSIEDGVLRAARKLAAERETTVNAMVREYLGDLVGKHNQRDKARKELLALIESSDGEIGDISWTREELYDR
jgi:hypothetical protein